MRVYAGDGFLNFCDSGPAVNRRLLLRLPILPAALLVLIYLSQIEEPNRKRTDKEREVGTPIR